MHGHRHRFAHALIRETLYGELGAGERVRLHHRIAEALLVLHSDDLDDHLSELAVHFCEASPAYDVERAVEFSTRAARQLERQLAFEEAASFYNRALRALESLEPKDTGRESELHVELGVALWSSGEPARSREEIRHGAELAERAGRTDVLVRAAIAYAGDEIQTLFVPIDEYVLPLQEKALAVLPAGDGALRATLLARIAAARLLDEDVARTESLLEEAWAIASRIGDRRALAGVIPNRLMVRWGTAQLAELRHDADTLARLAGELRDERLMAFGALFQAMATNETGDFEGAAPAYAEAERLAERHPNLRWFAVCARNSFELTAVRPAEAERRIQRMFELGAGKENEIAFGMSVFQRGLSRWQQGFVEEWEASVRQFFAVFEARSTQLNFLGAALRSILQTGSENRAAREPAEDPASIPRTTMWLANCPRRERRGGRRPFTAHAGVVRRAPSLRRPLGVHGRDLLPRLRVQVSRDARRNLVAFRRCGSPLRVRAADRAADAALARSHANRLRAAARASRVPWRSRARSRSSAAPSNSPSPTR